MNYRLSMSYLKRCAWTLCSISLLAGCAAPAANRMNVYDFGPGEQQMVATAPPLRLPAIVLGDVEGFPAVDITALLYRLDYSDAQQLRPYAQARWSMPPALLLRQLLREQLGQRRAVLSMADGGAQQTPVLRIDLEEFSQLFDSAERSRALVRMRATLSLPGLNGRVLAQTALVRQVPAERPDAAAGARALAQASAAAVAALDAWLAQALPAP